MKHFISIVLVLFLVMGTLSSCGCKHENKIWQTTKEPSCVDNGEKILICEDCGFVVNTVNLEKTPHSFGDWKITKNSTCTEQGEKVRYCKCGENQVQNILATGHIPDTANIDKSPTCEMSGHSTTSCTICNTILQESVILATGHMWLPATCTEASKCRSCDQTTGSALGHYYNSNGQCKRCNEFVNLSILLPTTGVSYSYYLAGRKVNTSTIIDISSELFESLIPGDNSDGTVNVRINMTIKIIEEIEKEWNKCFDYGLYNSNGEQIKGGTIAISEISKNESEDYYINLWYLNPNEKYTLKFFDCKV